MSDSDLLEKKQIQILKLLYKRDRTFGELSRKLHVPVDEIRFLCGRNMVRYLTARQSGTYPDYSGFRCTLTHDGKAFVESVIDKEETRRMETRHFWISILLGGFLGWLLSGIGSPKDLIETLSAFFSP